MAYRIVGHALARMRQRQVPEIAVEAAILFGKSKPCGRGRIRYILNHGRREKALLSGIPVPPLKEKLVVVVDSGDNVITVMWTSDTRNIRRNDL